MTTLFSANDMRRPVPTQAFRSTLRPYQLEAVEAIHDTLAKTRSALTVMATGLGKTQVFCTVADEWRKGRVLIVAHREELLDQASQRLIAMSGDAYRMGSEIGIEQADLRSVSWNRFVVGSNLSVYQPSRLKRLQHEGGFGLIIIDEAHRAPAKTYRDIIEAFPGAKVLGVTATPDRTDKLAMGTVFDEVAYAMDIEDGIVGGWLVPIRGEQILVEEVNLDSVGLSNGDLAAGELDAEMLKAGEVIAKTLVEREPTRQGIVFTPGVQSAHFVAERLNALEPGSAEAIDGETDKDLRRDIMDRFRSGKLLRLVNCLVATEGFDAPTVGYIANARPTKSRSLYAQIAGRGTRPLCDLGGYANDASRRGAIAASPKPYMTLYDFVGNCTKHRLVCPTDILGGKYTDAEQEKAKELAEKDPGADGLEVLKLAREELRRIAAAVQSRTRHKSARFDPFNLFPADELSEVTEAWNAPKFKDRKIPSQEQIKALVRFGWNKAEVEQMDARQCGRILKSANRVNKDRRMDGLASIPQQKILARYGWFDNVPFKKADEAIGYIALMGWGPKVDRRKLMQILGSSG